GGGDPGGLQEFTPFHELVPRSELARDVHVKLHLRMDAAEYQERSRLWKRDLHGFARLLRAGIEIESRIENPHVVGAGIVGDDPEACAALERNMLGMKLLLVLGYGAHANRGSSGTALAGDDLGWERRLAFARQGPEKRDQIGALPLGQPQIPRQVLG